jgi:hypothetical protein
LGISAGYTFWRWLKAPSLRRAAVAGTVLGLAELAKTTWIILFVAWPMIWLVRNWIAANGVSRECCFRQVSQLAVALATSLFVINVPYGFEGAFTRLGDFKFVSRSLAGADMIRGSATESANYFCRSWLASVRVPLPKDYVIGIDLQKRDFEIPRYSYLRGEWQSPGWWYYYLYALAIKEPLGTWCLVVLAVGMTARDWRKKRRPALTPVPSPETGEGRIPWRDEMAVLVPGLAILAFVSSQTGFSVHSRYVIPALPFLFIWASKVGRVFEKRVSATSASLDGNSPHPLPLSRERARGVIGWFCSRKQPVMAVLVALALIWSVVSSLSVYPHSLSYFNELAAVLPTPADASYPTSVETSNESMLSRIISAGPRNGPRHLLDSNIDWGQDLFYLNDWLNTHPEVKLDGLAYWGSYPATLAGIPETPMPPTGPVLEKGTGTIGAEHPSGRSGQLSQSPIPASQDLGAKPGWYALSVNEIYGRSQQYRYFLNFNPVATAGYSIYIYHITLDEANRVRRELGMEELKDEG